MIFFGKRDSPSALKTFLSNGGDIYTEVLRSSLRAPTITPLRSGRGMASCFLSPSTRTNFSFQTAMMRLGGDVVGFSEPGATSTSKGETLADTIRMMSSYSDVIVMRSPYEGAALAASLFSEVPIINAGDGGHFHPTQTLADLTTISQKRGGIGNLNVGICGDLLNGRTVHSLVLALSKFPTSTSS
jgi:aspartate carbamoyltransferase catalytic subunit